jgi:hypothetical protein
MNLLAPRSGKPKVRIVTIYSTSYIYAGTQERPLNEELLLGALSNYYDLYRNQLPRLLPEGFLAGPDGAISVEFDRPVAGVNDPVVDAMLFALPSNQVIAVVWFAFHCDLDDLGPVVDVLERGIEGGIVLNGQPLEAALRTKLADIDGMKLERTAGTGSDTALLPERHQLVFIRRSSDAEEVPTADVVRTIVYRTTPPLTEEFARPKTPEQLNQVRVVRGGSGSRVDTMNWRHLLRLDETSPAQRGYGPEEDYRTVTLGVVTPYVSLLFGHQEYIEESVLLSSVHAVGTASKFRQIWSETYEQVRMFRRTKQEQEPGRQTRDSLEELADRLGNLEFDLTFSVEFPQLRIESFQAALYDAMDLSTQAKTLSDMFTQVASSVRSEITAIAVREQRISDGRHKWNAFAAGLLSLAGISIGVVIAFLGINTRQVPISPEVSMWSAHFTGLYLAAGLFAFATTYLIAFPYVRDALRPTKRDDWRALWTGLLMVVLGIVPVAVALVNAATTAGQAPAIDAFGEGGGGLVGAAGLSILVMWAWYRQRLARGR